MGYFYAVVYHEGGYFEVAFVVYLLLQRSNATMRKCSNESITNSPKREIRVKEINKNEFQIKPCTV